MEKVIYLCDRKACPKCKNPECRHTADINHAVNFKQWNGIFIEVEEDIKPQVEELNEETIQPA